MSRKNRPMTNRRMFATMLLGSVFRRRSRVLVAVLSSAVGAATLFCLAAICLAVPAQMSAQMRQFGANLIVVPVASEGSAPRISFQEAADVDAAVATALGVGTDQLATAAYRYETVRINKSPYLVGGIDVDAVRALNGHWEIEGRWPGDGEVLIGLDVAESTGFKVGSTVNAEYLGSDDLSLSSTVSSSGDTAQAAGQASWRVSGIVDTGGSEDDILYVPLGQLETLTGNADAGYDVVEFSVDTTSVTAADVADAVNRAADAAGQGVRAEPVSKITSGDTRIITMLDTLFWVVAVVVLGLTLVGVSTTMTVIVSERRNEIGLRKALGASSRSIAVEFYTEAACLGLIGGLIGTAIGYALARAVGIGVFEQPIGFSWWLALLSVLLSALVAVIASAGPVQGATRIDPALVLREE